MSDPFEALVHREKVDHGLRGLIMIMPVVLVFWIAAGLALWLLFAW